MPALGREHVVALARPVKASFPESSACGNHRMVTLRNADVIKRDKMLGSQRPDTPTGSFKIVDQEGSVDLQFIRQSSGFNDPGQVRRFHATISDRTGNTETRLRRMRARGID